MMAFCRTSRRPSIDSTAFHGRPQVIDSSYTRAAIGWQPRYKTFGAFIDTLA